MEISVKNYPKNVGKKYCAYVSDGKKKITGWGNSEDEAILAAKNKLNKNARK